MINFAELKEKLTNISYIDLDHGVHKKIISELLEIIEMQDNDIESITHQSNCEFCLSKEKAIRCVSETESKLKQLIKGV